MKQLILLALLVPWCSFAQTTLSGSVKDESQHPIPYANVILKEATGSGIVGFCQADGQGTYTLKTSRIGRFWLNFSALSYRPCTLMLDLTPNNTKCIRNATLIFEPIEIHEVIISADKAITVKPDTIVFDARFFLKGDEKVVEDLLKKIPGLNISEDGTIRVGNQEVEKVMIDSGDFFEKGYKLLTRNMPAYPISKVELLQHFSNNRLLKEIENSEKVAINLKLDPSLRRQWFGNLAMGYDPLPEKKYEALSNLMNFGSQTKYYGLASMNSIGENLSLDADHSYQPSLGEKEEMIGEDQRVRSLINLATIAPNLKPNRYTFNDSRMVSLNVISSLSSKIKMKALAFLGSDINHFYSTGYESVSAGGTSFSNSEYNHLRKERLAWFGKMEMTDDLTKDQSLKYAVKYLGSEGKDFDHLVFNDSVTGESLHQPSTLWDHQLTYTHKLKKSRVMILTGRYLFEKVPQHHSMDGYFFTDLFPSLGNAVSVDQEVANQMHYGGVEARLMSKASNGSLLDIRLGNQYRSDGLRTAFGLQEDRWTVQNPDGFQNDLGYSSDDLYLDTRFRLQKRAVAIIADFGIHQLFNRMVGADGNRQRSQSPFFMNPKIGLAWKWNEKSNWMTYCSRNVTNAGIVDVYNQYVQTGYRTFSKGTGAFDQLCAASLVAGYTYGNWGDKFFANVLVIGNLDQKSYSTHTLISRNFLLVSKMLVTGGKSLIVSSNFDRFIKPISSNLKITLASSMLIYRNVVNNTGYRSIASNHFQYGFELRSAFHGFFNCHLGSKWDYFEMKSDQVIGNHVNNSFLDLLFSFNSKLDVQLKAERYLFEPFDAMRNCLYFLDFNARYVVIKNRLSLSWYGNNLFNTDVYSSYTLTDISLAKTTCQLLPRYLLIKVEYRF
ncbi:MAG: carboxypeptidase regulatory-like domain-containing protein [Marinilabiliales bacterium]|nr:carboxypeptidase regulatory-like domain-containing protein [Marinilabiliales bacterium]